MGSAALGCAEHEEFELRAALRARVADLRRNGLEVIHLSLAELVYEAVARATATDGGWERIYAGERKRGTCRTAVQTVERILRHDVPLADLVVERLREGDPAKTVTFLGRAGSLPPAYRPSALLAELANRINVPTILLYPGRSTPEGGLELLDALPSDASSYARIFK